MTEKLDIIVARIDENVKHIKGKIDAVNKRVNDHETRIRDNEKFKQRGYGALGILAVAVSVIVVIVGWIVIG